MSADSTTEKLLCPACGLPFHGSPRFCGRCGGDLRGIGGASETLAGPVRNPAAPVAGPAAGTVIDGRYRIREKLGEGGMGAVYRVEHVRMGKVMALKLMRPEAALDRVALRRFHQEARIVSRLSHPNTVSVFDFGELADGSLYMAMEYIPGRDLAQLLAAEGALAPARAAALTRQVLRSLAEAHDAGIIHRDIKPANVMLLQTREGADFVKVLDFGIAQLGAGRARDGRTTGADNPIVGTPHYMSPEQLQGGELDARSDIYSVGVLLFELLTGRCPFDGDTPLVIATRRLSTRAPRLRDAAPGLDLPEALEAVVERALERDPGLRFPSADAMREALAEANGTGVRASAPVPELDALRLDGLAIAHREDWDTFARKLRWKRRLAPVAALLALGGAGFSAYEALRAPPTPPRLPVTAEVEPNDGPRTANLIALGSEVQGFLRRTTRERSDHDLFEFEVPGPEPVATRILATGVPNVNLALDLYALPALEEGAERAELPNLASVDDRFLGGEEQMNDLRLAPGRYLVRVADRRRADEGAGSPRENTLDPYTLRVDCEPLARFHEQEPDNTPEQAMRIHAARPVFGHAGARAEPSRVQTATGETALAGTPWSDDYYELVLPAGATTGCVLLAGVRGATLTLATVATEHRHLREQAAPLERDRLLGEHYARHARERAARVGAGEVDKRCARSADAILFRVAAAEGASDERYVLVGIDDSPEGFDGVLAACDELVAAGESATCKLLLSRAIQALPVSRSVDAARSYLAELP